MTFAKFSVKWIELQSTLWLEVITRAFLSVVFLELEQTSAFTRKIHINELWLYKNPRTSSYVPNGVLWPLVFAGPTTVLLTFFCFKRNKTELCQSLLAFSLALGLNGVITDTIKIIVGRPRPDFFYRCFPDGEVNLDDVTDISTACKGDYLSLNDGRKSFPSGHSSFSFCSLGFLSLWIAGKLGVFQGVRSQGWKLVISGSPLMLALIIAMSRTCDYHHHWQDVLVGSLIGLLVSYLCYRQYYPRLSSNFCHLPYILIPVMQKRFNQPPSDLSSKDSSKENNLLETNFFDPESPMEEQVKWI